MAYSFEEIIKMADEKAVNYDEAIRSILAKLGKSKFEIEYIMAHEMLYTDTDGFLVLYDAEKEQMEQLTFGDDNV